MIRRFGISCLPRSTASLGDPIQWPMTSQHVLQPEQASQGLGIGQKAFVRSLDEGLWSGFNHIKKFTFIQLSLPPRQTFGKPNVNELRGIRNHRMKNPSTGPVRRYKTGFFEQFALCAQPTVLARLQFASRKLNHGSVQGVTVLALHNHPAIVKQRNDHHRTGVHDILSDSLCTVRKRYLISFDMKKMPLIHRLGVQGALKQMSRLRFWQKWITHLNDADGGNGKRSQERQTSKTSSQ